MSNHFRTLLTYIVAIGIVGAAAFILSTAQTIPSAPLETDSAQVANVSRAQPEPPVFSQKETQEELAPSVSPVSPPETRGEQNIAYVSRIPDPYPFPPQSFTTIQQETRAALINIFCAAESGIIRPISGSGVIIDPRGVILTNAHVAQYVLLAQSTQTSLSCSVRWGAPARPLWEAEVLYIPPVWIQTHAADITNQNPTGTGEHDYALLRITRAISPDSVSAASLPIDTREGIGFKGDLTLSAGYPAEFIGDTGTQFSLYPISSVAPIKELLTFGTYTVDLISLGGVIEAQGGSSGGPVVNAWGRLIGLITTTSGGATTAERELRAITLSYVSRDLLAQAGLSLPAILSGDIAVQATEFRTSQAPALVQLLIDEISKRQLE